MKFFKHWASAEATVNHPRRPWKVRTYGGSNDSADDARRQAQQRAERTAAAIERGQSLDSYGYGDRPLREETVETIRDGDAIAAVITRNAHGALVLNTNHVMFVDVDVYPQYERVYLGTALRSLWNRLRGKTAVVQGDREKQILSRFDEVCRSQPSMGFRVYRTSGGYRLLMTSGLYDPIATETRALLEKFGSDPLYIRLCKAQECFRARLSAKFWRCGSKRPPNRFPWADAAEESRYRAWEQEYHGRSNGFAVCRFIDERGEPAVHSSVQPILELHDRLTMQEGAPLA